MTAELPTVCIVDDDAAVREAIANLCRSVHLSAETFSTAQEFLASPAAGGPGCLILDVRLPGFSGLDLQRQLTEAEIPMPVIFVSGHADIRMSVRAMKAGAMEFLSKPFSEQELLDAIQPALDRDRSFRSKLAEKKVLLSYYQALSAKEQKIMTLVVSGLLNKQIAGELKTSEATVKMLRGRMMKKMHADSLAALVRFAQALDLPLRRISRNLQITG